MISQASLDFVQSSTLSTLIPHGNILDFETSLHETLNCFNTRNENPLSLIPQRRALFFGKLDETICIYAVLQTLNLYEKKLHSYLKRLSITIAGQILSSDSGNNDIISTQETMFTQCVQNIENPLLMIQVPDEEGKSSSQGYIFVVWKISVFLEKAKIRLQNASVLFTLRATLRPTDFIDESMNDEYLPSQVPLAVNLLEAFGNDSSIEGVKPRLSALRVSKINPVIQHATKNLYQFKIIESLPIKIFPAINANVKCSRFITVSNDIAVLVSVEIDIAPFSKHDVTIQNIKLHLKGGRIEDLNNKSGLSLPVTSSPMDSLAFTYIISLNESDIKKSIEDLEISVNATVNLSSTCQPIIEIHRMTSLSFTSPVNPSFLAPSASVKRYHNPNQLSIDVDAPDLKLMGNTIPNSHSGTLTSVTGAMGHELSPSVADFGITVTFTSSFSSPIYPGIPFMWNVFILNRSDRFRKLALIVIPNFNEKGVGPLPKIDPKERGLEVAKAVVDENLIYAMQKSSCRAVEVICLTTKQEVGPLSPMACHEVELKLMALDFGMIHVEAVRVVDLDTHTHIDVKDLPTIYISPPVE
ncbi:hypothetical protein OnM2_078044 [Erysiphe neolycopersici]|uniref:Trafficking protein particle complex II-specific subunit 65 IgD3 domain-containing protein n=1 Tax=Erysiphe neolycopersici TaxID=212602 RepID=A0A420HHD9_9PEZI|nr:hypothetical protein OnM2_078044 [Erysiphe neolycopersici]